MSDKCDENLYRLLSYAKLPGEEYSEDVSEPKRDLLQNIPVINDIDLEIENTLNATRE